MSQIVCPDLPRNNIAAKRMSDALDMLSTSRYLMRHAVLHDDRDVEWRADALNLVASWLRIDNTVIGGLGLAIRLAERALANGFPVSRHGMRLAKRALRIVEAAERGHAGNRST